MHMVDYAFDSTYENVALYLLLYFSSSPLSGLQVLHKCRITKEVTSSRR